MNFFNIDSPLGGFSSFFGDPFFADSDTDEYNDYRGRYNSRRNNRNRSTPVDNETYYRVLEVDKTASTEEINKAFRKQAKKYHPDRGGDAKTFQLINEAHEVLSDPKKRKIYDREGKEGLENLSNSDYGMDEEEEKGDDIRVEIAVNLETLYTGHSISVPIRRNEICSQCNGMGGGPGAVTTCRRCKGKGHIITQVQMGFFVTQQAVECSDCRGSGKFINRRLCCPRCSGQGVTSVKRNVDVYIEPGLKNRNKIRVSEQGHQLLNKRAGDLVVIIKEKQHNRFKRSNCDLGIGLHINVFESLLGFKQRITHLDGHIVEITNPPGVVIKPGTVYKIENEGMPVKGSTHIHGSLFVTFHVDFPDTIDPLFVQDMKSIIMKQPRYISQSHCEYLLSQNQNQNQNQNNEVPQYEDSNMENAPVYKCSLTPCSPDEFGHTIHIENNASSDDDDDNTIREQCRTF